MTTLPPDPGSTASEARRGELGPPATSNFSVHAGFGNSVPKRPSIVTAAGWLVTVFAVLSAVGVGGTVLAVLDGPSAGVNVVELNRVATTLLLFIGLVTATIFIRGGREGGRVLAIVLLGGTSATVLSAMVNAVAIQFLVSTGDPSAWFGIPILLLLLAGGLTTIALLGGGTSVTWFQRCRTLRSASPFAPAVGPPAATVNLVRPVGVTLAAVLLFAGALVGLVEIALEVAGTVAMPRSDGLGWFMIMSSLASLLVLIVSISAAALALAGRELGRTLAFIAAGSAVAAASSALTLMLQLMTRDSMQNTSWLLLVTSALTFAEVAALVVAALMLAGGSAGAWFASLGARSTSGSPSASTSPADPAAPAAPPVAF
jgi:hypothetical protein